MQGKEDTRFVVESVVPTQPYKQSNFVASFKPSVAPIKNPLERIQTQTCLVEQAVGWAPPSRGR